MEGAWRRAKRMLGLNLCVYVPAALDDDGEVSDAGRLSDAAVTAVSTTELLSPVGSGEAFDYRVHMPSTPTPTSSGLRLPKSGSRSSKRTCTICLGTMKAGHGHALFTAECSHTFHFQCISSNVKYGNYVCPVCRAKWKEIPFHSPPSSDSTHGRARVNPDNWPQEDGHMTVLRRLPRVNSANRQHNLPIFHASEPRLFNDDEPIHSHSGAIKDPTHACIRTVEIKTFPEFSTIPQSSSQENFGILIHLKAPHASSKQIPGRIHTASSTSSQTSRAPVDLVTVLDVSGSMAGTKLALLKRAMGFVIQNLGPSDRLSVIAFSSTARRLFSLCRMTDSGRQKALQAVNSLVASGGTNIADGLRKGAKVVEDRRQKNPVCSMILLSDGQDTYTISTSGSGAQPDYMSLVPSSVLSGTAHQIPIHTFGFGTDHDSVAMHSIAEASTGTFSFIEAEGVIQDAFAQCIGGLLSVVAQEMRVSVECLHPGVHLSSIKSGSYSSQVSGDGRNGLIEVGDLYADEERDFLVCVVIPQSREETRLLKVRCDYVDPVTNETVKLQGEEMAIQRPEFAIAQTMSIEVDRERNRIQAADAMAAARAAAERGALSEAVSILEGRRGILTESLAGKSGDRLCLALDAELREMQERMVNRQRYEASGRAYVLAGLSSHSWQRATARGDSTDSTSLVHSYQTPTMVDMIQRSQTLCPSPRGPRPPVRPTKSFSGQLQPR